jgi:hypothetical protein
MKTLIIHPQDETTIFLRHIYRNLHNCTLWKNGSRIDVISQIIDHDRIFMLGHGTPNGLLSVGQFDGQYVIDDTIVPILSNKECIFIWCNADKFVTRNKLKGLYSGMFISEVMEALLMGLPPVSQKTVDESNFLFATVLGQGIELGLYHAYHMMMVVYEAFSSRNIVAKYNVQRLYLIVWLSICMLYHNYLIISD